MSSTTATPARYRWTILAAGVFAQASFAALLLGLPSIAPQIRSDFDLSLTQTGIVLGAVSVGTFAAFLLWGVLADRIGERGVLCAGMTGAAVALVLAGFASSFEALVVALAAAGAFGAAVNAASGRAVMSWFGAEERGLALGIRQTAVPVGGAVAAGVLPALAVHLSVRAAFLALAAASLASAIVGAVLIRSEPSEEPAEVGRPLRDPRVWRLCIGSTFYVTAQISILAFLVLFLHDARGLSTAAAAGTFALTQVLGGAMRIAAGHWSDRVRARIAPLRQLGLMLSLATGATALLVNASMWLLLPALVAAGTLSLSWNGLSFTAAAETAGRARSGAAIGLQQTFLSVGGIVAPIAFAAIVNASSWRIAFALAAVSPLAGYALLSPLAERRPGTSAIRPGARETRG